MAAEFYKDDQEVRRNLNLHKIDKSVKIQKEKEQPQRQFLFL